MPYWLRLRPGRCMPSCAAAERSTGEDLCFWGNTVLRQDQDADTNRHCADGHFTAEEDIRASRKSPGERAGKAERIEQAGELTAAAVCVSPKAPSDALRVPPFFRMAGGKIAALDEYRDGRRFLPAQRSIHFESINQKEPYYATRETVRHRRPGRQR